MGGFLSLLLLGGAMKRRSHIYKGANAQEINNANTPYLPDKYFAGNEVLFGLPESAYENTFDWKGGNESRKNPLPYRNPNPDKPRVMPGDWSTLYRIQSSFKPGQIEQIHIKFNLDDHPLLTQEFRVPEANGNKRRARYSLKY